MDKPWQMVGEPDDVDIVAPDGAVRCRVQAYFGGSHFFIDDMSVDVQPGDEIRRMLPNGKEETFRVDDPTFYRDGPFGSHYQVKISRRGVFDKHTGGNYHVSVSGANSRVNIGSTDNSTNVAVGDVYGDIRSALMKEGVGIEKLAEIEVSLAQLQSSTDKSGFAKAYQSFVGTVADHITVVAPFLPALTQVLTSLPG